MIEYKAAANSKSVLAKVLGTILRQIQTLARRRQGNVMRLCETLSLGDRRFLAVVVVEEQRYLVGGAGNSIALLAQLPGCAAPAAAAIDQLVSRF
jgi:flagellar biogenesis protein FliO